MSEWRANCFTCNLFFKNKGKNIPKANPITTKNRPTLRLIVVADSVKVDGYDLHSIEVNNMIFPILLKKIKARRFHFKPILIPKNISYNILFCLHLAIFFTKVANNKIKINIVKVLIISNALTTKLECNPKR